MQVQNERSLPMTNLAPNAVLQEIRFKEYIFIQRQKKPGQANKMRSRVHTRSGRKTTAAALYPTHSVYSLSNSDTQPFSAHRVEFPAVTSFIRIFDLLTPQSPNRSLPVVIATYFALMKIPSLRGSSSNS